MQLFVSNDEQLQIEWEIEKMISKFKEVVVSKAVYVCNWGESKKYQMVKQCKRGSEKFGFQSKREANEPST